MEHRAVPHLYCQSAPGSVLTTAAQRGAVWTKEGKAIGPAQYWILASQCPPLAPCCQLQSCVAGSRGQPRRVTSPPPPASAAPGPGRRPAGGPPCPRPDPAPGPPSGSRRGAVIVLQCPVTPGLMADVFWLRSN